MNSFKRCGFKVKVGLLLGLALTLSAPLAKAEGSYQSFRTTNVLASAVVIVSYPTNTIGTNLTGSPVEIGNYERLGLAVSGYVTTAGTGTVYLVRSPFTHLPRVSTLSNNFETVSTSIHSIAFPMPDTGPYNWSTNIPPEWVIPGNWAGVFRITNVAGVVTNFNVGVVKKLLPNGSR